MPKRVEYHWSQSVFSNKRRKHMIDGALFIGATIDLRHNQIVVLIFITKQTLVLCLNGLDLLQFLNHGHGQIDDSVAALRFGCCV